MRTANGSRSGAWNNKKGHETINLLLAFYGDDFTGSTDVMESLTCGGVETVLFVRPPTEQMLARYRHVRAIGIAGSSRAMTPEEMEVELSTAFQTLLQYRPAIVHYKTCSTFDSSPQIGSIGRAIEIGQRIFQNRLCPLVVGAPSLQRFCVFGNLFARSGLDSVPYRLDRHPTMKCHPVTPMDEADLRVHLARQTNLDVHLIDVLALDRQDFGWQSELAGRDGVVLFDTLTDTHLETIGRSILELQQQEAKTQFVAGSSGVDYALTTHWRKVGLLREDFPWPGGGTPRSQTLAVSGSCSPVTERQIAWAVEQGFVDIALDTVELHDTQADAREVQRVVAVATSVLQDGRSVIVHTCRGPDDTRIAQTRASAGELGSAMASVLRETLLRHPLPRVAVTGGDTSGHVARSLKIDALEIVGPLAPGSPLCVARSEDETMDGLEITLKGGQVGHDDFFGTLLRGRP